MEELAENNRCCDNGRFNEAHFCQKGCPPPGTPIGPKVTQEPRNKGGRPKGFNGMRSKMPSAMAQRFKAAGLDWQTDFALAIKNNKRERIGMWMKLLPYLITTTSRASMVNARKWKGRPSKAAMKALEMLEDKDA